jgi:hypothetical protein
MQVTGDGVGLEVEIGRLGGDGVGEALAGVAVEGDEFV